MNLKPNLWTLLFLLTAGAWYYFSNLAPASTNPDTPNSNIYYNKFNQATFLSKYNQYKADYVDLIDSCSQLQSSNIGNLGIKGYALAESEIEDIFREYKEKRNAGDNPWVYIYPVINGQDAKGKDLIDIFLLVKELGSPPDSTDTFFDFTRPCPPTCSSDTIPYAGGN